MIGRFWNRYSGWFANLLLLVGAICVGEKWRYAFLFIFFGEAVWSFRVARKREWDMLFICVLFALIALRNFAVWSAA